MTPMSLDEFPADVPPAARRRIRFLTMLVSGPPDPLEWFLGTLKMLFGGWLLMPFSTFASAPHLYRFAAEIPESGWGVAFFCLGVLQWTSWIYEQYRWRFFVGVAAAAVWDFYGFQVWRGDHRTIALAMVTGVAAGQLLAVVWLYDKAWPRGRTRGRNAGRHDKD